MREVSDSRVRIYEQMEETLAELEAANARLIDEGRTDKNMIKV